MIKIKITLGKKLSVKMDGHAGDADSGKDLVCASASILAYTLAQNIKDQKKYCEKVKVELKEGDAEITCVPKEEARVAIQNIYATIIRGFQLLEANFPENISLQRSNAKHRTSRSR